MMALSNLVIKEFCKLCDWTYQIWLTHKFLFDENPNIKKLKQPYNEHFFYRLSVITHEYGLLQLAKLHDAAIQNGRINLTIDYIIEYGQWDTKTSAKLIELKKEMIELSDPIRKARNKILSHNDLAAILINEPLGMFESGKDVLYFDNLKQFANLVHEKATGLPFSFDDLVINDVEAFMTCFSRGMNAEQPAATDLAAAP